MKKFLTLLFFITLVVTGYSQSRSALIKEIKTFQNKTYKTAMYPTSTDTLKWVIFDYMTALRYQLKSEDSTYYVYTKRVTHPQNKYNEIESFVYVEILNRGFLKKVILTTEEKNYFQPLINSAQSDKNKPVNIKIFDKKKFYQYLYKKHNKSKVKLPQELQAKIHRFNHKATKHKKQIIQGRDY